MADRHGLSAAPRAGSVSPAVVKRVEQTLEERILAEVAERLIRDKA